MSGTAALMLAGALPVLFSAVFYLLEKRTAFAAAPYPLRQALIGVLFGGLAVAATVLGVDAQGAAINVRDAAPLAAGLIFGAPAGVIAGVIGGAGRWFLVLPGLGEYTRLSCSLATVVAGLLAAATRKHLLDNKKPSWFYALTIGMTVEVVHMLLVFLTKMSDTHQAFLVVKSCAGPMILANSLSVMLSVLAVSLLSGERVYQLHTVQKIAQSFQRWLLLCVCVAFAATCLFTWSLQTSITATNTDYLLRLNAQDVRDDISDASDENLIALAEEMAVWLPEDADELGEALPTLMRAYDVAEINLVGEDGIIWASTAEGFVGYDMAAGEQSAFFLPLLSGTQSLAQSYQPIAYDSSISRKYAGVALPSGGFLQVGYDAARFQRDLDKQVIRAARNRHIGQNGSIIICNEDWVIVSARDGHEGESLRETGLWIDRDSMPENTRFSATVHSVASYCFYTETEGYYIIAVLPEEEAVFSRDIAVYITVFMEIVVFAALFTNVYFLIKKLVVENIQKVNRSLSQITGGNLNVTVDVRSNEEFASLSDDINSTVSTLKAYIAEAAARIDRELEFARTIQHAALPSVFPPYPGRTDFDIFASMDAAKEVGGDFYDFYLLDRHTLAFLIADVSGKGIPAAMFMMTTKTLIKGLAESGIEVDEIFTRANEKLCEGNDAGMFVTAWMGILDLNTGLVRYANAGHNPPALRRGNGAFEYLRSRPNFILGGMAGVKYRTNELQLRPGDRLYLYTDGVTEATDSGKCLFGEARLLESLNSVTAEDAQALCTAVARSVDTFVAEAPQFDDITMLSLRLNYLQKGDAIAVASRVVSAELLSDFTDMRIEKLNIPAKPGNKLRVAVDEICTNIRDYSGAAYMRLSLSAEDGAYTLCIQDDGRPYNPLSAQTPDTTAPAEERKLGGLGIYMTRKLMDSMEYEYAHGMNILTMRLHS